MPLYWGPHKIVQRTGHSTVKVKVGTFANGAENIQTHHWSNLKPAELREDTPEAVMPKRGRPSKATVTTESPSSTDVKPAETSGPDNKKREQISKQPTRWSERIRQKNHATSTVECSQLSTNPLGAGNSNGESQQTSLLSTRPWSVSISEVIDLNKRLQAGYRSVA